MATRVKQPRADGPWMMNKTSRRSFLAIAAGACVLRGRSWAASAAAADEQRRLGCTGHVPPVRACETRRYGRIDVGSGVRQLKDPCPVFDGRDWHLCGSVWVEGVSGVSILHAQGPAIEGPYTRVDEVALLG